MVFTVDQRPSPVPSPPPVDDAFSHASEIHYYFHGTETRMKHRLHADTSLPASAWQLRMTASFLANNRDSAPFALSEFPARLLPFFTYRDVAIYALEGCDGTFELFDTIYREWYPTRDRTVFNDGVLGGCGAPWFGSTIRVNFEKPTPQLSTLLNHLVHWHFALLRHLNSLLPHFCALNKVTHLLVRPGLTQQQLQTLPKGRVRPQHVEYSPVMRRTFSECFVCVEEGWLANGVKLVVLHEEMLCRILSNRCEGLTRDMELEEQIKEFTGHYADDEKEQAKGVMDGGMGVSFKALTDHFSIWTGSLVNVMRAVVAGDETRKRGLREYNEMLDEWLGEGVNVGK